MINSEQWFYCSLCGYVNYKFECCGHVSCSGGGCDECGPDSKIRQEVDRIIEDSFLIHRRK